MNDIDQVNIHLPASVPTALTGLPADDELTGRTDELAVLATVLALDPVPDTPAICTIAGLGGVGKTTLAIRAARLAEDTFPAACCSLTCTVTTRPAG